MCNDNRPGKGRSGSGAVHPSTSTRKSRKSNNGGQNGVARNSARIAHGNGWKIPVVNWDVPVVDWSPPGWQSDPLVVNEWDPVVEDWQDIQPFQDSGRIAGE